MPASTTLPIIAGLSILGASLGVTLGRSAVAEINPAYFSDADDSFHADLVPYRSPGWAQAQPAAYQPAQQPVLVTGLGSGCIGCRDYPVEYVPQHDPAVDAYAESAPQPAQVIVVETPAEPDPARARIEAYASYAVSSDEKPAPAAEAPAAEAATEPTGL